jgi:hypothetical protein
MTDDDGDEIALIASLILRYLARHPDAADSIEGVQKWWLASQGYNFPKPQVEQALDRLIGEGRITRRDAASQAIYRRAADGRPA